MKYTIKIQYEDGAIRTWETMHRSMISFVLRTQNDRYGKHIKSVIVKGEHV